MRQSSDGRYALLLLDDLAGELHHLHARGTDVDRHVLRPPLLVHVVELHTIEVHYYEHNGYERAHVTWEEVTSETCDSPVGEFCAEYYNNANLSGYASYLSGRHYELG